MMTKLSFCHPPVFPRYVHEGPTKSWRYQQPPFLRREIFLIHSDHLNLGQSWILLWSSKSGSFSRRQQGRVDKAPRPSIKIVIWILPSDTLFGDDLYCICFDHPNRETAMLPSPDKWRCVSQDKSLVTDLQPVVWIPAFYSHCQYATNGSSIGISTTTRMVLS